MAGELTNEEYADIMMAYGRADGNTREAQRIYSGKYPNRRIPHRNVFATTYRRIRETGNIRFREPRVNPRQQYAVAIDEQIIEIFEEDPTTSIRVVAQRLGLSVWKVWSVLRAEGKYPFHYTPVQGKCILSPQRTFLEILKANRINLLNP